MADRLCAAAAFGGLSLFGYTTKKDRTGFGSFLLVVSVPAIRRRLTPSALKRARVRERALAQVLAEHFPATAGDTNELPDALTETSAD